MNRLPPEFREADKLLRRFIGRYVFTIPHILDMKKGKFYKYLQDAFHCADIKNYSRSGIPQDLSYDELENAILKAYTSYINDSSIKEDNREQIQEKWENCKERLLHGLKVCFSVRNTLYRCSDYRFFEEIEDCLSAGTVEYFRLGIYPEKNSSMTKDQVEHLRQCLNRVHPQTFFKEGQEDKLPMAVHFVNSLKSNK